MDILKVNPSTFAKEYNYFPNNRETEAIPSQTFISRNTRYSLVEEVNGYRLLLKKTTKRFALKGITFVNTLEVFPEEEKGSFKSVILTVSCYCKKKSDEKFLRQLVQNATEGSDLILPYAYKNGEIILQTPMLKSTSTGRWYMYADCSVEGFYNSPELIPYEDVAELLDVFAIDSEEFFNNMLDAYVDMVDMRSDVENFSRKNEEEVRSSQEKVTKHMYLSEAVSVMAAKSMAGEGAPEDIIKYLTDGYKSGAIPVVNNIRIDALSLEDLEKVFLPMASDEQLNEYEKLMDNKE